MTKIDEYVEKMIIPLIQATSDRWLKKSTDYKIYQPVTFNLGYPYATDFIDKLSTFTRAINYPFLGEITVTEISQRSQLSGGSAGGTISVYDSKDGVKLKRYKKQEKSLEKYLLKNKPSRAYKAINEMIRYNPFDKSLIQQRRRLEKQLGKDEYRVYDILWLQAMEQIASIQNKKP